jgi:type II secretion system (T2SS) protein C
MPRRFVALNVLLAALSAVLIAYIVRQLISPTPLPVGGRRAAATTVVPAAVETPRAPAGAYAVVASRNLFNPSRTDSAMGTTTTAAGPVVRPNLFGIVVRDGGSIAYLEDPVTKRVVGYRVGDKVVGGTVQTIKADSVVIERPEGPVDVRLRDPGKPRTVATPAQPGVPQLGAMPFQPAQPGQAAPVLPGVIPPPASLPPQTAQPQVPQLRQPPGVVPPTQSPMVMPPAGSRRPLPPNLLRRLPPGTGDAPQQ